MPKKVENEPSSVWPVLICDDDPMFLEDLRDALQLGVSPFGPLVEVTACLSLEEVWSVCKDRLDPRLMVMDLYMYGQRFAGIQALSILGQRFPHARKVAITSHGMELGDPELLALQAAAPHGVLLKNQRLTVLLERLWRIAQGENYVDPILAARWESLQLSLAPPVIHLTPREKHVLILRAQGYKSREIATSLGLGLSSVNTHLERIGSKLGSRSLPELRRYCEQHRLL